MTIDLKKFCSKDRPKLLDPFSGGEFTYASNGHIAVRVPRCAEYADNANYAEILGRMIDRFDGSFTPMRLFALPSFTPAERKIECDDCDGRGKEHDCPSCQCDCPSCNGTGFEIKRSECSVAMLGASFNIEYLRMIAEIPGAEVGVKGDHMIFRFDGGDGALMALNRNSETHYAVTAKELAP